MTGHVVSSLYAAGAGASDRALVPAALVRVLREVAGMAWMDRARCAETDPDAFFPDRGEPVRPAKAVCRSCEVRAECLAYALEHDLHWGIWGGTSENERRALRKRAA